MIVLSDEYLKCKNRRSFLISSSRKQYSAFSLSEQSTTLRRRSGSIAFNRPTSVSSSLVATISEFVLISRVNQTQVGRQWPSFFDLYKDTQLQTYKPETSLCTQRLEICCSGFSKISYFLECILTEHIQICRLASKVFFITICSIGTRSRK